MARTCIKPRFSAFLTVAFCLSAGAQQATPPIGELFASDGNAKLVQPAGAGMSVVPGSELSAGIAPARLRLARGGQVRLCPRSSLSVNSGRFGLMFAMNAGTIEIDYALVQRGSDFVITPDFSIQLSGPARYHFALGTNQQGDTCVRTLPGNSAPLQFSELLTAGNSRIGVQESVLFHGGKLSGKASLAATDACGCPEEAAPPVQTASAPAPEQPQTQPSSPAPAPIAVNTNQSSPPLPVDRPGQVHVEVDTPFVFSGKDAGVKPYSVAKLNLPTLPNVFFVQETVDPVVLDEKPAVVSVREERPAPAPSPEAPEKPEKKEKKGFFGRLKGFFGGMFHR